MTAVPGLLPYAPGGLLPISAYTNQRLLAANTAETVSIPTGAKYVAISTNIYAVVRADGVNPASLAGDVDDGTGGMPIAPGAPPVVFAIAADMPDLRVLSAGAATIGLSFYGAN